MKVTLISHTQDAETLLLFTKNTRLSMKLEKFEEIQNWSKRCRREQLEYMAQTIPSSWEFIQYVFMIEGVSRAMTHQLVRTRAGSYAQQSQRVTDMGDYDFVMPSKIARDVDAKGIVDNVNDIVRQAYRDLMGLGHEIEDARCILPTNISTNIVAQYNLRTLSELAASRLGGRTQDEYRRVMRQMVDAVLKVHPWAELFIYAGRDANHFDEIERYAKTYVAGVKRMALLKIVDKMRKQR